MTATLISSRPNASGGTITLSHASHRAGFVRPWGTPEWEITIWDANGKYVDSTYRENQTEAETVFNTIS